MGWLKRQLTATGLVDAAAEEAPAAAAPPLASAPAALSQENTEEVSIIEPSAEAGFRAITNDTDASYETDASATVNEEQNDGHTLGEPSLGSSEGYNLAESSGGYNLAESSGMAEMSALTMTDSEARSCDHSSPLPELSGQTSPGTHSPPSVCIDIGARSAQSSPIPEHSLSDSIGDPHTRNQMLSSHKPESVLLPPRLAALALKRGDTKMSMALGGAGRQIERRKQHRYATWMTSFEERIRADIALSFAHHDVDGSGGIDEERLRLCCTEVWPKIAKLMRDAPEFQQARCTYDG